MPTANNFVVEPKRPNPLAAMTDHKRPPATVGEINPADGKLAADPVKMNPRPSGVPGDLPLSDQTRNGHRRKIVNEKGWRRG
jgi:hypothetical protein